MAPYEVTLPVKQLKIPIYAISSVLSQEYIDEKIKAFNSFKKLPDEICLRLTNNQFEVVKGWDAIKITLLCDPDAVVHAQVFDLSLEQSLKVGLSTYINERDPHPILISDCLKKIHDQLKLKDDAIAEALGEGFSRQRIYSYRKLQSLSALSRHHFSLNHFSLSIAKVLSYKDHASQNRIVEFYKDRNFKGINDLLNIKSKPSASQEPSPETSKTRDEIKFETSLSELIGAPVELIKTGEKLIMKVSFFSMDELSNIHEQLSHKTRYPATGSVNFQFSRTHELNLFTEHLFKEDDF